MANKMLIDSSHPEETRVVVTRGQKVEEFDFESASRRPLRGNIYLAKVIRVEPSLQAAFVEYGGNRHGFLAFSEIHPDYYQIPVADRQALLEADAQAEREEEQEEERPRGRRRRGASRRNRDNGDSVSAEALAGAEGETAEAGSYTDEGSADGDASPEGLTQSEERHASAEPGVHVEADDRDTAKPVSTDVGETVQGLQTADLGEEDAPEAPASSGDDAGSSQSAELVEVPATAAAASTEDEQADDEFEASEQAMDVVSRERDDDEEGEDDDELEEHEVVEQVGGADALEDVPERPRTHRRHYKIQEVIKRRQILLVQVVKEERGNKGAALTTYLSLAGRYSVLMPNTGKGGGISRKITNAEDRKRLKEVAEELEVPEGMGIILRTAGASRTKQEIRRDYEYLMRLWESVRELTLESSAPALVYEEGSLIKRTIRDLYNKDIDELVVAGAEGYNEAKDFMRMIMPSHAKAVKFYDEPKPLFASHGIEAQLDAMFSSHVTLKSGGYLVINPTEALVSIDVNSGRSTREHNIEDTALRTNLEASEEIARQLRLRDLAGLIVIDFIDMEENRNNRAVEKKLKDCLKNDRARIQVGRISPFGLMEMSRQRIRTGVLESSSVPCPHCAGSGFVRSTPSVALQVLRSVEEALLRSATHHLVVRTRREAAFYILNQKRAHLREIEVRFGVTVTVAADEALTGTTTYVIDRGEIATPVERQAPTTGIRVDTVMPVDEPIEIEATAEHEPDEEDRAAREDASEEGTTAGSEDGRPRRRRRRRRGRGGGRETEAGATEEAGDDEEAGEDETALVAADDRLVEQPEPLRAVGEEAEVVPLQRSYTDGPSAMHSPAAAQDDQPNRPDALRDIEADGPSAASGDDAEPVASQPEPEAEPVAVVLTPADPDRPKRGGWWSKAKAALAGS